MSNTNDETLEMGLDDLGAPMQGKIHEAGYSENKVQPMSLATLDNVQGSKSVPVPVATNQGRLPLNMMLDVPITLVFEVGRTNITIKQLMELCEGSFISLRHISVDSVDIRINDEVIAEGQSISIQQQYGIRFGEVAKISRVEGDNENI